jgi:hypothetical protein
MILAKSQKIAVRLYLQPQRAASLGSSVPLWWGSVVQTPAPAACLGQYRQRPSTPGAADPCRHAAGALEGKITRWSAYS